MNILTSPDAFFQEKITNNEDLRIPALIILAIGIIGAFTAVLVAQLSARMMPEFGSIILIAAVVGTVTGAFFLWLIWSGLIYGLSLACAGEGSFKRTLEFTGYGFIPQAIGSVITLGATLYYLPHLSGPAVSPAHISQGIQGVQAAMDAMMQTPAMIQYLEVTGLVTITFFLWSAFLWINGIRHARNLSPRDAILCAGVPSVLYVIFLISRLGA
jgi:hypothetical protein